MLNTFGTVRDLKYFNSTEGTGKEGTVYGSKDVGMTSSSILNYIENAIFDTNQMRYYSPESGLKDALYEQRRDLSNLMQKLEDQGYTIPEKVSSITSAAKTTASTSSKGQAMINTAIQNRTVNAGSISNTSGYTISNTVKNALLAGGYTGIDTTTQAYAPRQSVYAPRKTLYVKGNDKIVEFGEGTYTDKNGNIQTVEGLFEGVWGKETLKSDDNKIYRQFITTDGKEYFLNQSDPTLVPWHQTTNFEKDLVKYKETYMTWKKLPIDQRPNTWYDLLDGESKMSPEVYNEMVLTNFDTEKVQKYFTTNTKKIEWKQLK